MAPLTIFNFASVLTPRRAVKSSKRIIILIKLCATGLKSSFFFRFGYSIAIRMKFEPKTTPLTPPSPHDAIYNSNVFFFAQMTEMHARHPNGSQRNSDNGCFKIDCIVFGRTTQFRDSFNRDATSFNGYSCLGRPAKNYRVG